MVKTSMELNLLGRGLTTEQIERFDHFTADKSPVGKQCIVCPDDLQAGMKMVRLDCRVNHYFCKTCTDIWFKDYKKCTLCSQ